MVGQTGTWRNDIVDDSVIAAKTFANVLLEGEITKAMEAQELECWKKKLAQNNITLGPLPKADSSPGNAMK